MCTGRSRHARGVHRQGVGVKMRKGAYGMQVWAGMAATMHAITLMQAFGCAVVAVEKLGAHACASCGRKAGRGGQLTAHAWDAMRSANTAGH